jgi:hypothetical protein
MGKIVVTEFVSVDGVSDDPAGVEGFERGVGRSGPTPTVSG